LSSRKLYPARRLDVKKRFSEEQIIRFLREADKGIAVKELCRKHGFSEAHRQAALGYGSARSTRN
jgi:hypothetical protein